MGVLRFVLDSEGMERLRASAGRDTGLAIAPVVMPRDRAAVASLADEAREGTVSFSATGLLAELESRDARRVTAWIAWRSATLGPRPVGVVMLAETDGGFSIPWLLVDPDVRRQGVARTLVTTAVCHALARSASSVSADTLAGWAESAAFWPAVGFRLASKVESD